MKKKGWALLLTAALLGTVCGCGGAEEPGSIGSASSAAPAVQQEEPPAEEAAEISIPQLSWPIIFRGGRFTMATRVLPTSSSGL